MIICLNIEKNHFDSSVHMAFKIRSSLNTGETFCISCSTRRGLMLPISKAICAVKEFVFVDHHVPSYLFYILIFLQKAQS